MLRDKARDPILIQVLSVYLLLLAFFVLLNGISNAEPARTEAVAGSLEATFAGKGRPSLSPALYSSALGDVVRDPRLERRLGRLVRTELELAEVEAVLPGRIMELVLHGDVLFRGPGVAINPAQRRFLEEIAAIIATPSRGVRYQTEILVPGDVTSRPGERELDEPAARAAFLAQVLAGAGAPPRALAAGVEPSDSTDLRLLFYVRPAQAAPARPRGRGAG